VNKYKQGSRDAQKRRRQFNDCLRKASYPSKQAAEIKGQQVYKCPHCKKWHRTTGFSRTLEAVKKTKKKR